ncbi:MAG: signal peptidase II [Chlamydiae bacterium]|nr:signal peptidase II [Chlamydiota bacterium]
MPDRTGKKEKILKLIFSFLVLIIFFIDQCSKHFIDGNFYPGTFKVIIPNFFNITLAHNSGSAFGAFPHAKIFLLIINLLSVMILMILYCKIAPLKWMKKISLSLILGGAFGNLFDRIFRGYVVDFFDVYIQSYHWYTFNVADSAITVGAVFFAVSFLKEEYKKII